MKITFLGTGTSSGIPMIGCDCAVCRSSDPHNRRRRTSVLVEAGGLYILIDTPPDFREQALAYAIPRVDAVLFTHAHADHIMGFDDIRRYNALQDAVIPAFAAPETLANIRRVFDYIGTDPVPGVYRPRIDFREINGPFKFGPVAITPIAVQHDAKQTHGFRIEHTGRTLGYVPDCAGIKEDAVTLLQGVDVMVLDGLRHRPHRTHLTVAASVDLLRRIGAKQSYLIHLCHDLDHEQTRRQLPEGIDISYDGMVLNLPIDTEASNIACRICPTDDNRMPMPNG